MAATSRSYCDGFNTTFRIVAMARLEEEEETMSSRPRQDVIEATQGYGRIAGSEHKGVSGWGGKRGDEANEIDDSDAGSSWCASNLGSIPHLPS